MSTFTVTGTLRTLLPSALLAAAAALAYPTAASAWIEFLPCKINFFSRDCVKAPPPEQPPQPDQKIPNPPPPSPIAQKDEPPKTTPQPDSVGPTEKEVEQFLVAPSQQKANDIAKKLRETMTRVNYGSALLAQALAAEWASMGYNIPGALPLAPRPDGQKATFQFPAPDRPTILYFAREGCPFCTQQEPILADLAKASLGHVQVVGIAPSGAYPSSRAVPFPFIPGDALFESARVTTTPTMIFLAPQSPHPGLLRGLSTRQAILEKMREVAPGLPHWIQ